MLRTMTIKHSRLSQAHKDAISRGVKRYWSENIMSQERRENISKGQKKRLAKRSKEQVLADRQAISKGTQQYYDNHDGPWKGIKVTEQHKQNISKGLKRYWKQKKAIRKKISNGIKEWYRKNNDRRDNGYSLWVENISDLEVVP